MCYEQARKIDALLKPEITESGTEGRSRGGLVSLACRVPVAIREASVGGVTGVESAAARRAEERQVKDPKIYVRDSGLLHALVGVGSRRARASYHPKVGA